MKFGDGPTNFAYPIPHFGRRVDVDALWVSGTQQTAVLARDRHCNRAMTAITITARAGTTTGGTNQANIWFSCKRPTPSRAILAAAKFTAILLLWAKHLDGFDLMNGALNCVQCRGNIRAGTECEECHRLE
jgi:hypothetical protein